MDQRFDFVDQLKRYEKVNILDLGCGTGSLGHGFYQFLQTSGFEGETFVGLIDQQGPFLDAARLGYEKLGFEGTIKSHRGVIENSLNIAASSLSDDSLNVILLGYVWNEVSKNPKAQRRLMEFIDKQQEKNTIVLVLEPANQFISRSAMELRDQLNLMSFNSLYPCLHNSPCPMLNRSKD